VPSLAGITTAEYYKERVIKKLVKLEGEHDSDTFCMSSKVSQGASENRACDFSAKMSQIS
jgi:hypothetical protein